MNATERAERRARASEQHRLLVEWEKGGQKGKRPETPDYDAIQQQYAAGGAKKTRKAREPKEREYPTEIEIRKVFENGTLTTESTVMEIARAIDAPRSSTNRSLKRMFANGEMVRSEGRGPLYWLIAAGEPADRAEPERAPRQRRSYHAATKAGTVHECHRVKIEDAFTLVPVCVPEGGKIPAVEKTDDEVTCKRCLKAAAAAA